MEMMLLPTMVRCSKELFLLPKFDNSSPARFAKVTLNIKIKICRDEYDFQTGDLEQFKIDSNFLEFGQVKIDCTCLFLMTLGRSLLFY